MGSTDFNTAPRNMTLIALSAVVGLHVLAAMALVTMKPSTPVIKAQDIPPIEIQMVTLPISTLKPEPVELTNPAPNSKPIEKNEPEKSENTSQVPHEIKAKPEVKPETKPKTNPIVKELPPEAPKEIEETKLEETKIKNIEPEPVITPQEKRIIEDKIVTETVIEKEPRPIVDNSAAQALAEKQRQIEIVKQANLAAEKAAMRDVQQAAEKAAQEKAQAAQEAEAAAKAQENDKAKADAKARVETEAKAKAKEEAEAKAKAEAASNTPMNFSASNANWASKPNFSFPDRASRGASSGDTFNLVLLLRVNKQGGIDSVSLAQSSGNTILDREALRQVRSGKFRPFMNNGVPVVGNVTLPVSYAVP